MNTSVYQPWFNTMGWKMQSILSNGLRAPDVKTEKHGWRVLWYKRKRK